MKGVIASAVIAAVIGLTFFDEVFTGIGWLGAAIVVAAVFLTLKK